MRHPESASRDAHAGALAPYAELPVTSASIRTMSLSMLQVEGRSQHVFLFMGFLPLPDRGHGVLDVQVGLHGRIGIDNLPSWRDYVGGAVGVVGGIAQHRV